MIIAIGALVIACLVAVAHVAEAAEKGNYTIEEVEKANGS